MALKPRASFSAGELDPALQERTTLQKFQTGLKTARNVVIGKTGRLLSKAGRKLIHKSNNTDCILYACTHADFLLEIGPTESNGYTLDKYRGSDSGDANYSIYEFVELNNTSTLVFIDGEEPFIIVIVDLGDGLDFFTPYSFFRPPAGTHVSNVASGAPSGYEVEYAATFVFAGEESAPYTTATGNLPVASGQLNTLTGRYTTLTNPNFNVEFEEARFYRRPRSGGAFGLIGSATGFSSSSSNRDVVFKDVGQEADYSIQPPILNSEVAKAGFTSPEDFQSPTGAVYQQKLILAYRDKLVASRTGFYRNFFRDFPINADSSLSLKIGTEGYTKIIRLIDSDGLVVFTSRGVFLHVGPLTPQNLALEKKGSWLIDERVRPIAIPGGVLFVDKLTNSVRHLQFSDEIGTYTADELSIFSDHLFRNNRVTSWAFEDGDVPLLWVTFSDKTYASFTFEREQQMRAWTRHDSGYGIVHVASRASGVDSGFADILNDPDNIDNNFDSAIYFAVLGSDGKIQIEKGLRRRPTVDEIESNPEAEMGETIASMSAITSWSRLINEELTDDDMTLTPVTPNDWEGELTLSIVNDGIFTTTDLGMVGQVFRWFNPVDKSSIDLEVTARASDNSVTVVPSAEFPEEYATNPRLYLTRNYFYEEATLSGPFSAFIVDDDITVTPVTPGVWDGLLDITTVDDGIFTVARADAGKILYYYDETNKIYISLTVTVRTNDNQIRVQPSHEFPSTDATNPDIFRFKVNRPLYYGHLEGESVSIICDGYVIASPNNDIENYPTVTVTNGQFNLPSDRRGAIVHVGLPWTQDIETLDVESVEQSPTLIESKLVNKLYIKTYESRGLYVGNKFPEDDKVNGMEQLDYYDVDYEDTNEIIGNTYDKPTSKRVELTLPGDWRSNGRVCIRQVDPLHFEILSIITDLEILDRDRR